MTLSLRSWNRWLQQPDCHFVLEQAARWIYRQAAKVALPPNLLPCSNPWSLPPKQRADCFRMLADDLWIHFTERGPDLLEKKAWQHWAEQSRRILALKIAQHYFNHLKDRARTLDQDPGRSLYRRLRQVLKEDRAIHYRADSNAAYFSLVEDAPVVEDSSKLNSAHYRLWESPLAVFSESDLVQARNLVQVARRFWELARDELQQECYLPVRELAFFLQAHYGHLRMPRERSIDAPENPAILELERTATGSTSCADMENQYTRSRLTDLARQLAAELNDKQAAALYWIAGAGLTLQQAAQHMGYQGPAGVRYPYRRALDSLRDFCRLWPGLAEPELDDSLFDEFMEALLRLCKKRS